jgi:hypothetical protein
VATAFYAIPGFSVESKMYRYEPATAVVTGTIERQTFPGRPGYDSIKDGDEIETGLYLRLSSPIDVIAAKNATDHNSSSENGVEILQLAWNSGFKDMDFSNRVGKKITIQGSLFHAFTAHHHARVLILVEKVVRE